MRRPSHFFFTFALLLFVSGCGSLRKPKNIIPVTSASHPQFFTFQHEEDEQNKRIYQTPQWIDLPNKRVQQFYLLKKKGKKFSKSPFKVRCSVRWSQSVVPAALMMPFFPVGSIFGGAMLMTDIFTAGAYGCEKPLQLQNLPPQSGTFKKKVVLLPFPAPVKNTTLNKKILKAYQKLIRKKGDFEVSKNYEDVLAYGLNSYRTFSNEKDYQKNFKPRVRYEIAYTHNASHLVFFDVKESKDGKILTVKTKTTNAYENGFSTPIPEIKFKVRNKESGNSVFSYLVRAIRFIPNSLTIGFKNDPTVSATNSNTFLNVQQKDHPDSFPKVATLLGFESVEHPQFYDSWDYGFFLTPGLGAQGFRLEYNLADSTQVRLNTQGYFLDFSGRVSGFSPFGIFSLSIGPTLSMLFQQEDISGQSFSSTYIGVKVGFSHQLFLSNRIFTNIAVSNYSVQEDNKDIFPGAKLSNIQTVYIGLGYYFPQMANFANKWLSSLAD